jgi:ATP-dependent Clp protease ATP-binding subunit ClpC
VIIKASVTEGDTISVGFEKKTEKIKIKIISSGQKEKEHEEKEQEE